MRKLYVRTVRVVMTQTEVWSSPRSTSSVYVEKDGSLISSLIVDTKKEVVEEMREMTKIETAIFEAGKAMDD